MNNIALTYLTQKFNYLIKITALLLPFLYHINTLLGSPIAIVGKTILFLYIIIGFICLSISLIHSWNKILIITFTSFIFLNLLYFIFADGVLIDIFYTLSIVQPIKNILFTFLTFFIFYYLTINSLIKKETLIKFYIAYLCLTIIRFYFYESPVEIPDAKYIVNNTAYIFVNLLPFIFLLESKKTAWLLLSISMLFLFISLKRGAIISALLFSVYYVYTLIKQYKTGYMQKMLVAGVVIVLSFIITSLILENSDNLQNRLNETIAGKTSSRNIIYMEVWNYWNTSEQTKNYFFGYGFSHSPIITDGKYAHNDWLELLSGTGLIGIVIYYMLFFQVLNLAYKKNVSSTYKKILYSVIIIWFFKSMFSMGYTSMESFTLIMLLGFIAGELTKNKEKLSHDLPINNIETEQDKLKKNI